MPRGKDKKKRKERKDKKFKIGNLNVIVTSKPLTANKKNKVTQVIGIGGKDKKTDKIAMMLVNEAKLR